MPSSREAIVTELVARGKELLREPHERIAFTGNDQADSMLNDIEQHPHLFVLGCVMDRQIKAERAWIIPYRFSEWLGSTECVDFAALRPHEIRNYVKRQRMHRFCDVMSRNFHAAIQRIAKVYREDAGRLWNDEPSSAELVWRFLEFRGVGPKIATMATNILARQFKIQLGARPSNR